MKIKLAFEIGLIGDLHKNQAGLYRVADELLRGFNNSPEIELFYSLFAHQRSKTTSKEIEEILAEKNLEIKPTNQRKRIEFLPFRKEKLFKYFYKKWDIGDYKIKNFNTLNEVQIYHTPYFPIPKNINKLPNIKKVVTVHDLIPLIFPNYNTDKILINEIFDSIGSEGFIISVSESTKKDILQYYPEINPNRIFVSLLAADPEKFYVCKNIEKRKTIQEKYNLPNRYFLGLSTLEPRKNIDHVIRCFIQLIKENNIDDLSLVLVGSKGWQYEKIFEAYEDSESLKEKIIITGRIPDEDLASVYSNAEAFFYMSIYEGFGLPPLEAMQCGVPTVVSNNSSLPEVVGDAGILLDAKDKVGLYNTMFALYSNENLRKEYSEKSLKHSQKFSWEKTVAEHINIYKKILNI